MRWSSLLVALASASAAMGCGSDEGEDEETCEVDETYEPSIVPADFSSTIDNPLFPLPVGRKWTYKEGAQEVVVSVLPDKKQVMGVDCVVVRDTVTAAGVTVEDTWDWYAQNKDGSVWYFGEDTTEYADGKPVSKEGSWEAGVEGAQPGVIIPASPSVGAKYKQEYLACEAEDMAEVLDTNASFTGPTGSYTGCLKTHDFTPLDPDVNEQKTYCPGVGLVVAIDLATGEKEELQKIEGP